MKIDFSPRMEKSWISSAVGGALGVIGTIASNLEGDKTRRRLLGMLGKDPQYTESPYAKSRLGLATQLLNSRMPGATAMERNIYANQANYLGQAQRNATDSSQLLALGAAAQGQTNEAFGQLGISEAQDYYRRLENYNQGNDAMTQEHHASFDDKVRRWQDEANIYMARNQIRQNQGQSLVNLGSMFMGSSFGGGGKGGGGGSSSGGSSGGSGGYG